MYVEFTQPRLTEFLGETFEATWRILGEKTFPALASDYFHSYPKQHFNLFDYGLALPDWVADSSWRQKTPFLADLARFEWNLKEVSHMPQHASISKEQLQTVDPSLNVRLIIGHACRLFESPHAVFDIWKQCFLGNTSDRIPWERSQRLALYKQDGKMCIRELTEHQYLLLRHLKAGNTITESLELALNSIQDISQRAISDFFQMLFHAGLISHIETLHAEG